MHESLPNDKKQGRKEEESFDLSSRGIRMPPSESRSCTAQISRNSETPLLPPLPNLRKKILLHDNSSKHFDRQIWKKAFHFLFFIGSPPIRMTVCYGWVPNKVDLRLVKGGLTTAREEGVACLTISGKGGQGEVVTLAVMIHSRIWNSCGFFEVMLRLQWKGGLVKRYGI
ncbi:hypothetical protein CDAR_513421 [Caerostris darwini]|uniref:Uncharacterized protein n=1 Tax=Caerostris darwini TaxID=1538125 RepID=A0AAV4WXF6_9ARAC|nr:hypothetical protein CDAR_513421 [Caerostris darwini]